jgi:3-oxoadipate CoA-transferase, beta subunit
VPGAAIFHHADSFAMIRGGHIDVAVLGAYEVSRAGDLANWAVDDGTSLPGVGGAMDLAAGARRVCVLSRHTRADGSPKLVEECSLPLTAPGVVTRFYSDLAVVGFGEAGPSVIDLAPGVAFADVQELTGTKLAC